MERNVKTNVSRGGRNTSGVTEKLTVVGDTAHPILFTKKVSALQIMGMEMVSTPLWGIVKGIYHVVEVGQ